MKAKVFLTAFLFISIIHFNAIAQHEAAVWFLTFPISPSQNAVGYTGTSLPNDDPYGFLLNPAQLGYTSQHNNFSFMYYPSKINLWEMEQFQISGYAFNLGYDFNDIVGIPISLGFGIADQELKINYSDFFFTGGSENKDRYKAYSIGLGIDYYIEFFIGLTFKSITSEIFNPVIQQETFDANANTIDYGILLNVPILKLIDDKLSFDIISKKSIKPFFNISFGYSQLNIGDEIYYVDPAQTDPLPRTARLGYGISTGLNLGNEDQLFKIVGVDFSVDAEDLLLKFKTETITPFPVLKFDGYDSFTGDISIGRNIIQVKGDDNVLLVHAGFQLSLLESFIIKSGHIKGKGPVNRSTNGFEIRTSGILKFLSTQTQNPIISFISNHFDIRYYNSNYKIDSSIETNIKGLALYVQNLDLLF